MIELRTCWVCAGIIASLVACDRSKTEAAPGPQGAAATAQPDTPAAAATTDPAPGPAVALEPGPAPEHGPAPEPEPPSTPSTGKLAEAPLPAFVVARLGTTALRHAGVARAVALAPDGATLASADNQGIRLWSSEDGALRGELEASRTVALAYAKDGALISAGEDGALRFWDLASREQAASFDLLGKQTGERANPTREASALAISADASLLIAGHEGGKIAIWDLAERERRALFDGDNGYVSLVAISPDRSTFATADYADRGATVAVFDVATSSRVATLTPDKGLIESLAFTPDNASLVIGTQRDGLHLWSIADGALVRTLDGEASSVGALAVTADGARVYAASGESNAIRSFDLATGAEGPRFEGHGGEISSLALAPTKAGLVLASASADHTVRWWDASTGEARFGDMGHGGPVSDVEWSLDGSVIATACLDGKVRLWDAKTQALRRSLDTPPGHHRHVALSRDAAVVVANAEAEIFVFDGATGALRQTLDHGQRSFAVAVSPDGEVVVSGGFGGLVIWSAAGERVHALSQGSARVASLRMSGDGARVASGWDDGRIRVVDVGSGEITSTIRAGVEADTLAYAQAGTLVAARTKLEESAIFVVATGEIMAKLTRLEPLTFGTNDQLLLASGTREGEPAIHIIDVAVGDSVQAYIGHAGDIVDAAFAPDGTTFVTGSEDTTALIWTAP